MRPYKVGLGFLGMLGVMGFSAPGALQSAFPAGETFSSMPSWDETYNATWNGDAAQVEWSIVGTGGAADGSTNTSFLRGYRSQQGSSVLLEHYTVPAGTNIWVGLWMRCPSNYDPYPGVDYWMEAGYKLGNYGALDYDTGSSGNPPWQLVMKFDYDPATSRPNGNGDQWTWYAVGPIDTGTSTTLSFGVKLGTLWNMNPFQAPAPGPDAGWDGLYVSDRDLSTPPGGGGTPPPGGGTPPPGGGGPIPTGGRDNDNGDRSFNDRCGCGTITAADPSRIGWIALFAALGLLALGRRAA